MKEMFGLTEVLLVGGLVVLLGVGLVLNGYGWVENPVEPEEVVEVNPEGEVAGEMDYIEPDDLVIVRRATPVPVSPTPLPAPNEADLAACKVVHKPVEWFGGRKCYAESGMRRVVNFGGGDRQEKYAEYIREKIDPGVEERLGQVCGMIGAGGFEACSGEIRDNLERFKREIFERDRLEWEACDGPIAVGEVDEKVRNKEMFWRARMDAAMVGMYLYCWQNGSLAGFGFR